MNISKTLSKVCLALFAAILLFTANTNWAQEDSIPKKRPKAPTTVKGVIGGESHNSYVIRASRGKILTVQISWQRKDDNKVEFTIS